MRERARRMVALGLAALAPLPPLAADKEASPLPVLSRVILGVNDGYVDPERIDPRRMVFAALVSVEKRVPEVVVRGDPTSPTLGLLVGTAAGSVELAGVDSIWKVRTSLGPALDFVRQHLVSAVDPREIELAAVQGMLSTLDPHTHLLEPKELRGMNASGRAPVAGVGLVFAVRDGKLTVVKVLKNSPGRRGGLQPKDVITEIDGRSTAGLELQAVVDALRGKPQSPVALVVVRPGWAEPKRFELIREPLRVESIGQTAVLDGGIGYVRVLQMSGNASTELRSEIDALTRRAGGALRGLVLDLRGNFGGLLDEAIRTADVFLSRGVIATAEGSGRKKRIHDVKEATADATDVLDVPLAVLVNGRTAAGAEIVASALRENGRAVILGRPTFGQDSIQVLHVFGASGKQEEDVALKLTVARFTTPGASSVQATGVAPDVLLRPGRFLKDDPSWFAPLRPSGEARLPAHFDNPSAAPRRRSPLELHYLLEPRSAEPAPATPRDGTAARSARVTPEEQEDADLDAEPEQLVEDEPIRLAREILGRAQGFQREQLLETAGAIVAAHREEQRAKVEARLRELGIDWGAGAAAGDGTPRAAVTIAPPPDVDLHAGGTVAWTVTVENQGTAPLERIRAWTRADTAPLLDGRELLFGRIMPGQRRSWTVPIAVPRGSDSRRDEVAIHFEGDDGPVWPDVATSFGVVEDPGSAAPPGGAPPREPLRVALVPDPAKGAPTVKGDTLRLQGSVSPAPSANGAALGYVLVFVGERKVLFQQAVAGSPLTFGVDLPLEPGMNLVTVAAHLDEHLEATRRFGVFRRPPGPAGTRAR